MSKRKGGHHNHYRDVGFARLALEDKRLSEAQALAELRKYGEHVITAAKAALKEGVDEVVAEAKSNCPVKTGRLRDSIRAVPNKDGSAYYIVADASKPTNNPDSADGRFYYGPVVEFSPKKGYKPFMYPAIEAHWRGIRDSVDAAISKATRSG